MNKTITKSTEELVAFKDSSESWQYSVGSEPDYTFQICDNNDADLGNFFERPLKIRDFRWGTGTTLFEKFNPWSDYFTNPRVINRVSNFNLMRAKLNLKIIINGNGFHYGRAIASYIPYLKDDFFTVDRAFFRQDIIQASQRPHIYLDPTLSQGGNMVLPFVWDQNALSIPDQEWDQMGEIIIHTLQGLKHANGANDSVTVSVFAWATEVSLAVPTSAEPGSISPQAGDEYGKGPISRPASILAKAAGSLRNAPVIGPYARATEMAASATSAIATTFGYSRPAVLNEAVPYRPTVMGNLANTNMPDSTSKLSTDSKQEVTLDSRVVGLNGTDEMTINGLACRESYLTSFPWQVSNTPETALFNIEVTPQVWDFAPTPTEPELHLPACAFATLPFAAWRGSMKYRFQIVSSAYHKGRLKIVYEPYFYQTNEYNTNYTYVVDIAEDKDFTIDIGWGVPHPWARCLGPGDGKAVDNPPYSSGGGSAFPQDRANGVLRVYVVNELTVPNSTINNDIEVNVFVAAGEDLCVANPSNKLNDYSYFRTPDPVTAQAGDEIPDADATDEPSKPLDQEIDHTILQRGDNATAYDHVFYGETIVSFRSLLKRYNRAYYDVLKQTATGVNLYSIVRFAFPKMRGYAPGALVTTIRGDYNYGVMSLINYLTPAYVGWRGGLRYKVNVTTTNDKKNNTALTVTRLPAEGIGVSSSIVNLALAPNTKLSQFLLNNSSAATAAGSQATNLSVNPVLEFEMPFQTRQRFLPARRADHTSPASNPNEDASSTPFQLQMMLSAEDTDYTVFDYHVAGAEDFSLYFFVGAPIMYYQVPVPLS